ncbi:tall aerial hyphae-4 [Colletotrichum musicola]|uniref:Tall aerial hyphae-4 n=1 Tax=Colletotrichum musicola TaxID=2175873 RepID=A0A8H6MRY1_9PEZI|nr:tall aerial hyphae-4 [Colletotrichum musicola]
MAVKLGSREADISAFAASEWAPRRRDDETLPPDSAGNVPSSFRNPSPGNPRSRGRKRANGAHAELMAVLPDPASATLLVDNYFDKIHWFMLIFFQTEFRERFKGLYASAAEQAVERSPNTGFLSLFLAVCLTSLQYTSTDQKKQLSDLGTNPESLQESLLVTLKRGLLDISSLGSIEAVQTCILLGSFYLYHGEPELAWPICGCGLRIAQALKLHRQPQSQNSEVPDLDDPVHRGIEARKRCWWAIYEIETFCSMLYGFPLSIVDGDCDVDLPSPYPLRSKDATWNVVQRKAAGKATLLSYKHAMGQLSVIVKSALSELYGTRQKQNSGTGLVFNVEALNSNLRRWHETLPIQALALKLAFENARILVHRPLLPYKASATVPASNNTTVSRPANDTTRASITSCRDAALQIANVTSTPQFQEVTDTYAASFVALHLFTAGVSLSIMTTLEALSREAFESKMGLRQLMSAQSRLKDKSIVAEQGFKVLKKLMMLVISKETEKMLDFETPSADREEDESNHATQTQRSQGREREDHDNSPVASCIAVQADLGINHLGTSNFSNEELGFSEDPSIAQTLLDFEQAIGQTTHDPFGGEELDLTDPFAESCFGTHDQSWMWNLRN